MEAVIQCVGWVLALGSWAVMAWRVLRDARSQEERNQRRRMRYDQVWNAD